MAVRSTLVVPSVYGPAGDWVKVRPSPSGSKDPLLTDAFELLHKFGSVATVTSWHRADGGTPTVPLRFTNAVVDEVAQLELSPQGVSSVSITTLSEGLPNGEPEAGAKSRPRVRFSEPWMVAAVGWTFSRL